MPNGPQFSIVIPTRNRPQALAACLEACAGQDYPRDCFEVVVVDDGGQAPLDPVVARFRERIAVSLIVQPHAGPGLARNAGAAAAQGKYLAFTDDDCTPAPDWLRRLAARFEARPEALVGGRVVNADPSNVYCAASQAIFDMIYEHLHSGGSPNRFFTSNNLAVSACGFQPTGGFYEHAAEDRDFCDRWLSRGHEMIFAPEAVVHHAQQLNLLRFFRVHFSYGRGAFRYHEARSRRAGERFRFYPVSVVLMLRYPLWRNGRRRGLQIGLLVALAKVVNMAGFLAEAGRARLRAAPRPPAAEKAEPPHPGAQA